MHRGHIGGTNSGTTGAVPPMPLTDAVIRNSHPRDRAYKLFDGDGLHLLIQPSGSKLWRMRYILSGKERMLSFGPYPAVTLAAARKKRDEARLLLRSGTDPRRQIVREGQTFEDVARAWHANREDSLDPAHAVRVLSRLERDAFPTLGAKVRPRSSLQTWWRQSGWSKPVGRWMCRGV